MPDYAESSDDIIRNVLTFDHGKLGNANEKQFYRSQLKNIRHFVALPSEGEHIFAPGNFTIYKANDLLKRLGYGDRSGGEPPRILKTVGTRVGFGDSGYRELEAEFLSACTDLGIKPSSHRTPRTYWVLHQEDAFTSEAQEDEREIEADPNLAPTEKDALIKARRGHGRFRAELKARWQYACAITGCYQNEVLRASHIKPWKQSTNSERLDHRNGILLSANLDALFDRFLISFKDNGEMIVSKNISADEQARLGIPRPLRLRLSEEERGFMEWHRRAMHQKRNL